MKKVAAIILAAGSSSRMGQSKQLLKWNFDTLLGHTVKVVKASEVDDVIVVLGAREDTHRRSLGSEEITIVSNKDWEKGMGSSVKAGLAAAQSPTIDAVVILVCDQPFVTREHLNNLIGAFHQGKASIIASQYDNTNGVPALFGQKHFHELMSLADNEGAKKVISSSRDAFSVVLPDGGFDIDTPGDYAKAISKQAFLNS